MRIQCWWHTLLWGAGWHGNLIALARGVTLDLRGVLRLGILMCAIFATDRDLYNRI